MKSNFGIDGLFDFSELSPSTQQHLKKVYAFLSLGIILALAIFCLCQQVSLPGWLFGFLGLISIISEIILIFINRSSLWGRRLNYSSFFGYAASLGGGLGSQISLLDRESRIFNYRICLSAFTSVLAIFAVFSIFSILTSNRIGIYFFSVISSLILGIISIFIFGGVAQIIIGMILAVLYIISDTQSIIYRNKNGSYSEPITDAKVLFVDMAKLFYKIYEYLSKKEKEDKEKKKK